MDNGIVKINPRLLEFANDCQTLVSDYEDAENILDLCKNVA